MKHTRPPDREVAALSRTTRLSLSAGSDAIEIVDKQA
jgi:hypothetical protein